MEWKKVLESRLRARRQILFSKEDEPMQCLMQLMRTLPRKALILWALEMAEETVRELEMKYPESTCARNALETSRLWAQGKLKMPIAKRAILDCHAMAKHTEDKGDIARFHAVGQACGTIHTHQHAIGYPIYALTALIRDHGMDECEKRICSEVDRYRSRLLYWSRHDMDGSYSWASFIHDQRA